MNPEPNKISIGTSGFSYPDWQGVFYPQELAKAAWLAFYGQQFNFCELNYSYYRMPQAQQLEQYLAYPVTFAVKAHRSLTHERLQSQQARQDFLEAVSVLQTEHHLACVLLQFPYSFGYTREHRRYLLALLEDLDRLPLVVEFRHPHWYRDSVFAQLQQGGWGLTMVDAPQVKGGMPVGEIVTSSIAYLRFHGRNRENWWTGDSVSRYDYDYSQAELKSWLPRISAMAQQAQTVYIAFNNHARGQAVSNARVLKRLLQL